MLFTQAVLDGIAAGTITRAFRRWRTPRARAGGRQRTSIGVLAIDAVDLVREAAISERDARHAGFASRAALCAELAARDEGDVYRISFHVAGPDPRVALRDRSDIGADELAALRRRLARLDAASRHGPWTSQVLREIDARPGTRAADLAAAFKRDTKAFKIDVRKLKELGLTESLEVGYRLSPRGRALFAAQNHPLPRGRGRG